MVSLETAHANEARILSYFYDKEIHYERVSHPAVLTVDEQAKHVDAGHGALTKNLLLKDKKGRLILISALTSTTVDLKLLAQRLGLGKGGMRMAPLENLTAVLQVPEGCVTPLALFQETARKVTLLLDKGFQSQERVLFHPLSNDATVVLQLDALEAFLRSIDREPNYVDLEAVVAVGKDQPPDLAPLLQAAGGGEANGAAGEASQPGTETAAAVPAPRQPAAPASKSSGKAKEAVKAGAGPSAAKHGPPGDDVATCAERILSLLKDSAPQDPKNTHVADDLQHILVMFKNAAYTQGFSAAKATSSARAW